MEKLVYQLGAELWSDAEANPTLNNDHNQAHRHNYEPKLVAASNEKYLTIQSNTGRNYLAPGNYVECFDCCCILILQ